MRVGIVLVALLLSGCGAWVGNKDKYRYFIMAPDTTTVRDTVSVPPCWPPGHCKEQGARDRAAAFKAR